MAEEHINIIGRITTYVRVHETMSPIGEHLPLDVESAEKLRESIGEILSPKVKEFVEKHKFTSEDDRCDKFPVNLRFDVVLNVEEKPKKKKR